MPQPETPSSGVLGFRVQTSEQVSAQKSKLCGRGGHRSGPTVTQAKVCRRPLALLQGVRSSFISPLK